MNEDTPTPQPELPKEKRPYDKLPRILTLAFDNESNTNTLGFLVFFTATAGLFVRMADGRAHIIDADTWLLCVAISTILIGGKLAANSVLEAIAMRLKVAAPAGQPAAPAAAEPKVVA